jgi:hypothetical protein
MPLTDDEFIAAGLNIARHGLSHMGCPGDRLEAAADFVSRWIVTTSEGVLTGFADPRVPKIDPGVWTPLTGFTNSITGAPRDATIEDLIRILAVKFPGFRWTEGSL